MQKYHDEPRQYKGYLKNALGLKLSSPTLDDGSTHYTEMNELLDNYKPVLGMK